MSTPSNHPRRLPKILPIIILSFAFLVGWSVQPVPLKVLKSGNKDLGTSPTVLIGAQSHLLPLVGVFNFISHPFRKTLVPLDAKKFKKNAVESLRKTMKLPPPYEHGEDFGDFLDMEVMEEMIRVCEEKCHTFGRFFLGALMTGTLKQNLHLTNILRSYPEVQEQKIEKPIFLSAYTRTGATFLYQVLADVFDQELEHIKSYEVLGGAVEAENPPNRHNLAGTTLQLLHTLVSPLKFMHEFTDINDPEEDSGWYMNSMRGVVVPFSLTSQRLLELTFQANDSPFWNHRFMEAVLKLKQWEKGQGTQRFLLKAPEHLFGMTNLAKNYPDAKFVTVFRDEVSMYPSVVTLTHQYQHLLANPTVEDTVRFADTLICEEMKALKVAHNGTFDAMQVPFHRLFNETLDIVSQFSRHTNLPWNETKQAHAQSAIEKRLSWKKTKMKYKIFEFLEGLSIDDSKEKEMHKIEAHLHEACEK